ncbi:hypothetical protein NE237_006203 [Protea cynaroides]|uniref:Uncharacterized protein n=1 Tax=Protea cynaroides TaxID=273540 RepID=A0A9Q0KMN7_9MAGN|nr:hypothetical protein NE237_006203 [Protea cynaroides]
MGSSNLIQQVLLHFRFHLSSSIKVRATVLPANQSSERKEEGNLKFLVEREEERETEIHQGEKSLGWCSVIQTVRKANKNLDKYSNQRIQRSKDRSKEKMLLTQLRLRNEYSLGAPELYMAANCQDPKAILDGVAVAGLVGVLRQLGDLAE